MRFGFFGSVVLAVAGVILIPLGATGLGVALICLGVFVPAFGLYFWALWQGSRRQSRPLPTELTVTRQRLKSLPLWLAIGRTSLRRRDGFRSASFSWSPVGQSRSSSRSSMVPTTRQSGG